MPKYKFRDVSGIIDNDSEYESDVSDEEIEQPIIYRPVACYPSGQHARVRRFASIDQKNERVVVSPLSAASFDKVEVCAKRDFFKALYPDRKVKLIPLSHTYRLILPVIPGVPYAKLLLTDALYTAKLFLSAIKSLQDAHKKGVIVIDLKEDNIHYDIDSQSSFLVDGGLSSKIEAHCIDSGIFCCANQDEVNKNRKEYFHIAPECWSVSKVAPSESMDIYSLGIMMLRKIKDVDSLFMPLLEACLNEVPEERPSLNDLALQLELFLRDCSNHQPKHRSRYGIERFYSNFLAIAPARISDERAADALQSEAGFKSVL